MKKILAIFSLFVAAFAAEASDVRAHVYQFEEAGIGIGACTAVVDEGETVTLHIPSNPTTGYDWEIAEIDGEKSELVEQSYEQLHVQSLRVSVGTGGFSIFKFKAKAKGETQILLKYVRSWEKDVAPVAYCAFILDVK